MKRNERREEGAEVNFMESFNSFSSSSSSSPSPSPSFSIPLSFSFFSFNHAITKSCRRRRRRRRADLLAKTEEDRAIAKARQLQLGCQDSQLYREIDGMLQRIQSITGTKAINIWNIWSSSECSQQYRLQFIAFFSGYTYYIPSQIASSNSSIARINDPASSLNSQNI